MKKLLSITLLCTILFGLVGCTEKQRARQFGGETTSYIPSDRKLVNVTWKNDNLWILTRKRIPTDLVESYEFFEDSSFGMMEGKITIIER